MFRRLTQGVCQFFDSRTQLWLGSDFGQYLLEGTRKRALTRERRNGNRTCG